MNQSSLWERLEHLRPSLPRHIHFQRRNYSGELWYVLHDKSNGRFHRLSSAAYRLIGLMNGRYTLQQILNAASQPELYETVDEIPTREELIELMQYLHVADLLICDLPPNTRELFERKQQKNRQKWTRLLVNPLTWKVSLGNPDALLTRLLPLARFIASPVMGFVWFCVVGYALLQAGNHWSELTTGQLDNLLSPTNLLLLWLTYPLLKIIHELAHGLFTKVWGGDVHEYGVVFILATPLPYVDATASTAFVQKSRRLMVSAAGMAVELFLAALALLVWLQIEDGVLRDILYNVIIIGSVSTLFFNGNPLMRFDGYHLLCDAIDSPNLATRANQQVAYLVQTYGYGVKGLTSPAGSRAESWGLSFYAVAAFCYRLFVLAVIILLIARYSPKLGMVVGAWLIFFQILLPLIKRVIFLFTNRKLAKTRKRSFGVTLGAFVVVMVGFFYLPLPMSTSAEGVLWLPDDAQVRADSSGVVREVLVAEGAKVTEGQALIQLSNPQLEAELTFKQALLKEYQARYQQAWAGDRAQAQMFAEDVRSIEAEILYLEMRVENLLIRSSAEGHFSLSQRHELVGRYLRQGDIPGLITKAEAPRIRVALTQAEIGIVGDATRRVGVRLASNIGNEIEGNVSQEVPSGTFVLPSPVLGAAGGGRLAVDTRQADGTTSSQKIFLLDVSLPELNQSNHYGERAYVVFRHPAEPLATQLYRNIRQLFITNSQN